MLSRPPDMRSRGDTGYTFGKGVEGVDVEVPATVLMGEDPPEVVDVGGNHLRVISLHDLMMDRLVHATDRTEVTWDEVIELAEATGDRVNWDAVRARCMVKRNDDIGLHILPQILDEVLAELTAISQRKRDNPGF